MTAHLQERCFHADDTIPLAQFEGPGAFVATPIQPYGATRAGTCISQLPVWWEETNGKRFATQLTPELSIAVPVSDRQTDQIDGLAFAFAEHLQQVRLIRRLNNEQLVVSSDKLPLDGALVRIPHLIQIAAEASEIKDQVIWEYMTQHVAEKWLGNSLPDQTTFEQYLPNLLQIRRDMRDPIIRQSNQYRELVALLSSDRYVSILFVYQHHMLFRRLINDQHV